MCFVQRFIKSSQPPLSSLDIDVSTASELVPLLRLLPYLTSLKTDASSIDRRFLKKMVAHSTAGTEFKLAPLLEDVVLDGGCLEQDKNVRFIDLRWRATRRSLRPVDLSGLRQIGIKNGAFDSSPVGPLEALKGCVEEGLNLVA